MSDAVDFENKVPLRKLKSKEDYDSIQSKRRAESPLGTFLAGITRTLSYTLKQMGIGSAVMTSSVRKRAFMTLGKGAAPTTLRVSDSSSFQEVPDVGGKNLTLRARTVGMIKSSVLGFTVFGIYELLIFHRWPDQRALYTYEDLPVLEDFEIGRPVRTQNEGSPRASQPSPLIAHIGAGGIGGLLHSLVVDAWEIGSYWLAKGRGKVMDKHLKSGLNRQLILRRCIFHSMGFAILFGSYEWIRRHTVSSIQNYFSSGQNSISSVLKQLELYSLISRDENGVYDMTAVPMGAAFMAGGLAGQSQFIFNHYTKNLRIHGAAVSKHASSGIPKAPSLGGVARSFLPAAVCFVAFQYGGEIVDRWLNDDEIQRPLPVYMHAASTR